MTEAVPPEQLRVTDADRTAAAERLRLAQAEGALTLTEFDVRVAEAWRATTRGELARLVADLPPPAPATRPTVARRGPVALRVLATVWLSVSVLNLVVWGLVCLTTGRLVYPWWVWVAAPSGAVLGAVWWMFGTRRPEGA